VLLWVLLMVVVSVSQWVLSSVLQKASR
jgi:hypothetical protein